MTVFLLSDGHAPVVGTPFDRSLNVLYREYRTELQRVGKPFVTMFTMNGGQFAAWDVSADLEQVKAPEETPAVVTTNSPPVQSPSLATNEPLEQAKAAVAKTPPQTVAPTTAPIEAKPPSQPTTPRDEAKPELATSRPAPEKTLPPPEAVNPPSAKSSSLPASRDVEASVVVPLPPKIEIPPSAAMANSNLAAQANEGLKGSESIPEASPVGENSAAQSVRPAAPPAIETPQQTAVALPPSSEAPSGKLAVWGASLLAIALSLLSWSWWGRGQRRRPSLISRSLSQKGK